MQNNLLGHKLMSEELSNFQFVYSCTVIKNK